MEDSRLGRGAFVGSEGKACIDHAGVTSRRVVFMQEVTGNGRNCPTPMGLALEALSAITCLRTAGEETGRWR